MRFFVHTSIHVFYIIDHLFGIVVFLFFFSFYFSLCRFFFHSLSFESINILVTTPITIWTRAPCALLRISICNGFSCSNWLFVLGTDYFHVTFKPIPFSLLYLSNIMKCEFTKTIDPHRHNTYGWIKHLVRFLLLLLVSLFLYIDWTCIYFSVFSSLRMCCSLFSTYNFRMKPYFDVSVLFVRHCVSETSLLLLYIALLAYAVKASNNLNSLVDPFKSLFIRWNHEFLFSIAENQQFQ